MFCKNIYFHFAVQNINIWLFCVRLKATNTWLLWSAADYFILVIHWNTLTVFRLWPLTPNLVAALYADQVTLKWIKCQLEWRMVLFRRTEIKEPVSETQDELLQQQTSSWPTTRPSACRRSKVKRLVACVLVESSWRWIRKVRHESNQMGCRNDSEEHLMVLKTSSLKKHTKEVSVFWGRLWKLWHGCRPFSVCSSNTCQDLTISTNDLSQAKTFSCFHKVLSVWTHRVCRYIWMSSQWSVYLMMSHQQKVKSSI